MRAQHDPLAPAGRCPGCAFDPRGYDHEAVLAQRPRDFDRQVVALVREGVTTGKIGGYQMGERAARQAHRYLVEIGLLAAVVAGRRVVSGGSCADSI